LKNWNKGYSPTKNVLAVILYVLCWNSLLVDVSSLFSKNLATAAIDMSTFK